MVDNYQNGVKAIGVWKEFYEVYGDEISRTRRDRKLLECAIGFIELRLESHTRCTGLAVVLDVASKTGPIKATLDKT